MAPADLEDLYRLAPAQFVVARDAKAAEARAAGDRRLAAEIKGLRRPTQGAWMVNWLARERAGDLARLLEMGAALRAAQDKMAGEELRTLSRQRHAVVAALAGDARRAAAEAGLSAGEATSREVEETLTAALADDQAAVAVRAGHLSTALHYTGFGAESRGPDPSPTPPVSSTLRERDLPSEGDAPDAAEDTESERRRQEEAEHKRLLDDAEAALHAARAAAGEAHRRAGDHARRVADARERVDRLCRSIQDLEARLHVLHEEEGEAVGHLRDVEVARDAADREAAERDEESAAALSRLEGLRS